MEEDEQKEYKKRKLVDDDNWGIMRKGMRMS